MPGSSRKATNVFDAIKKPPSVAMEKIQSSTAATLDRMAVLQQRYRQHKEAMNSDNSSDKSRRTSTTSTLDSSVSPSHPLCRPQVYNFSVLSSLSQLLTAHLCLLKMLITVTASGGRMLFTDPIAFHPSRMRLSVTPIARIIIIRNLLLIRHKRLECSQFVDLSRYRGICKINRRGM